MYIFGGAHKLGNKIQNFNDVWYLNLDVKTKV